MENNEKVLKFLQRLTRNAHKPDLHSFKAHIRDGVVFVEARHDEIIISERMDGDSRFCWRGSVVEAAKRLEQMGLDLDSIET